LLKLTIGEDSISRHKLYTHELSNPGSLGSNFIFHIQPDPENERYLWLGTRGGGLNRMDTETGEVRRITTRDGLPNNVVYSVLPRGDDLWLSTNRGLSRYNLKKNEFINFSPEEGLQDYEFNYYAFEKTSDGYLVFGGVNGINVFRPEEITTNTVPPLVAITEVKVNNATLPQEELYRDETALHYLDNQIGFRFSALDFFAPRENQYRYKMEGVDPDWNTAAHGQEVSYANLSPGSYRFRVAGTNNSGLWSEDEAVFSFVIHPPWWNTTLAHISYMLLVFLIIYALFRLQVKRSKERHQIAFEQMTNQRLLELDRLKNRFFTNITHEIRTPLTLIIEPIRRLKAKLRNPELKNYVHTAEKNSLQLMSMVNQLLDLSKIESGKMQLKKENRNISQLVCDAVDAFLPLAEEKGIQLIAEVPRSPIFLYFDSDKFSQVVNNLLSNAVKYCPAGGKVWVVFQSEATEDGSAYDIALEVTDTGPGIPKEYREKVFERFFQIDNEEHSSKGTGVGLSYTRQILHLMNGTIACDNPPGKGARFTVKLQLEPALDIPVQVDGKNDRSILGAENREKVADAEAIAESNGKELILVVEDNPELRNYIRGELGGLYEVIPAVNGKDGLEKAQKYLPDLVISDLMMPEMDGMELCSQLKNHQLTSHIPVLLLTAKTSDQSRLTGYQTGADDYLTKPFNLEELMIRMRSLLDNRNRLIQKLSADPSLFRAGAKDPVAEKMSSPHDLEFLERFDAVIEDNLDNSEISTDEIARLMFLSRVQLHRKIKAVTGRKTSEYIRNYRLNRAVEMLRNSEGSVREVAIKVGFSNRNYFSQKFKELHDSPPSSFLSKR
jgi:signal transduction histidine kinase/DNA-binding response OmpR family regulator